jgi:dienelactone hydrolase
MNRWLVVAFLAQPILRSQSLLDELEARAKASLDHINHASSAEEANRAREPLRKNLEQSLGYRKLPWPPSLQPTLVGTVPGLGYRIEKIVFQTLPGTMVPAHLYLPEGLTAPAPAILFYNGHWWPDGKTRPDFQAFCINMARFGFIVFNFDAFGQGERGISSRDHRRTEALLVGIAQQGIAEYESQCALEYLLSRQDVDRARVGMTGASGGGYNTWITSALDDRIRVVVPVVGTSEFFEQIHDSRRHDWYQASEHCHFVPGLIRYANNHELLAAVAPRPLLIIAASVDQSFPIGGVRAVHQYGQGLYRSYDASGKIGLFVDTEEGHGYQIRKREAAYGWFLKWLMTKGDGRPYPEPSTVTLPFDAPQLRCFPPGQNQPAGPGIIGAVVRLAKIEKSPIHKERLPTLKGRGTLVVLYDRGEEASKSDPFVATARKLGWYIRYVDLTIEKPGWAFAVGLLLNDNFVWREGTEVRRVIDSAPKDVMLYARGDHAALAAVYALAQGAPAKWAVLREGFVSYSQFIERPKSLALSFRLQKEDIREQRKIGFDHEIPHEYFMFDGLNGGDLPVLLSKAKAKISIVDPIDGDWEPMH